MNDLMYQLTATREELEVIYNGSAMNDDGEPITMYDYLADILDMEYTISSQGDFLWARLWVTLGGPNVWIDTRNGEIRGAWGTERAELWLPSEISEELNNTIEEYWNCIKGGF